MSSPRPGPDRILRELERLRATAESLAARENRLREGLRQRDLLERRRADATRQAAEERRQARVAEARTVLEAGLQRLDARATARIARVREAQRRVRKAGVERLDAEEGRRKFELQRTLLQATRERDAGVAAAEAAHARVAADLDARQAALQAQEAHAVRLFGVLGSQPLHALAQAHASVPVDTTSAEPALLDLLAETQGTLDRDLHALRRQFLPALSRLWPVWLVAGLVPFLAVPVLEHFGLRRLGYRDMAVGVGLAAGVGLALHLLGRRLAGPAARRVIDGVGRARMLLQAGRLRSADTLARERARLEAVHAETTGRCNEGWSDVLGWLEEHRQTLPASVDARGTRALARNEALRLRFRRQLEDRHAAEVARLLHGSPDGEAPASVAAARVSDAADPATQQRELAAEWSATADPVLALINSAASRDPAMEAGLDVPGGAWTPPQQAVENFRIGSFEVDFQKLLDPLPADTSLLPHRPDPVSVPVTLRVPGEGSLILEAPSRARTEALGLLNRVLQRLLAGFPPGRVAFTLFDPVGLGQSFAALTHLADEAGHLIHGRIWTQSGQIEERLAELNEHLEKVIQMYLRNEYPSIAEYNRQAGNIAEKLRFLVLADFPAGFTDLALRRLLALAATGARCGVHLLVHWDPRHPLPSEFPAAALRQAGLHLVLGEPSIPLNGRVVPGARLVLDPAPDTARFTEFIHRIALANRDSHRVEVPFSHIAPPHPQDLWSLDTASELRVPIGRTGATKLQYLALGKATRQHALIAGKTGSGKSTLFHVLITNLALWCRPDQVEFYLVDFKKGVEFKCYATHRLPHARVVAIESDRDFGLSVLQRLDEELRRRGDLFRAAGVQDLAAYRRSPGATALPRVLLLVDEFQEFFVEEDRIAQNASVLLDRIVRQGRAFGIHVVLGSQTLGGAYTVARSTLGQMVVRIALQCNEADAFLIMDEDNPAPRLLSRPGEGIYNDAAGAKAGNSPFQVVWLPDDVRDAELRRVRQLADERAPAAPGPLVFEGDAPADVRENPILQRWLSTETPPPVPAGIPAAVRTWLGAPNSIKGPTEITLSRRSGDSVLLVGQRDDALVALATIALVALAAQHAPGTAQVALLDASPPDSPDRALLDRIRGLWGEHLRLVRPGDAGPLILEWAAELQARTDAEAGGASPDRPTRYLFVLGLQQFRALRQEDEFAFGGSDAGPTPAAAFRTLLTDGPAHGLHAWVSADTYGSVSRFLGRKLLGEFGLRVLFQMSANDSASLVDHPGAARLGLHRALLHLERDGTAEIFRPYALPDGAWFDEAARVFTRRTPLAAPVPSAPGAGV